MFESCLLLIMVNLSAPVNCGTFLNDILKWLRDISVQLNIFIKEEMKIKAKK